MIDIAPSLSNKMKNMSLVCSFLVVLYHVRMQVYMNGAMGFVQHSLGWWVNKFVENGIVNIAVPFFFLVAGYFVCAQLESKQQGDVSALGRYGRIVKKRLRTLVVPYFAWIGLFWLFMSVPSFVSGLMKGMNSFWFPSAMQWGFHYGACPWLMPLWFVRALFILVVISPLLFRCIRRCAVVTLLIILLAYCVCSPFGPCLISGRLADATHYGILSAVGVGYFSFCIAWRLGLIRRVRLVPQWALAAGCLLTFLRVYYIGSSASAYFVFASIPLYLYGVWQLIPSAKWPCWLTESSFAVYLIHVFVIVVLNKIVPQGQSVVWYLTSAVVVFAASVAISIVLRRVAPRVANILFGGR